MELSITDIAKFYLLVINKIKFSIKNKIMFMTKIFSTNSKYLRELEWIIYLYLDELYCKLIKFCEKHWIFTWFFAFPNEYE